MAGDFFAFTTLALLVQDSEIREYWRPQLRSLTLREGTQGLNSYESLVFFAEGASIFSGPFHHRSPELHLVHVYVPSSIAQSLAPVRLFLQGRLGQEWSMDQSYLLSCCRKML